MEYLKMSTAVLLCVLMFSNCNDKPKVPADEKEPVVAEPMQDHVHEIEVYNLNLKQQGENLNYIGMNLVRYVDEKNTTYLVSENALLQNTLKASLADKDGNEFVTTPSVALSSIDIEGISYQMLIPVEESKVKMKGGHRVYAPSKKGDRGCTFYFERTYNEIEDKVEVVNFSRTDLDSVMVRMVGFEHVGDKVESKVFWYFSDDINDIDTINKYLNRPIKRKLYSGIDGFTEKSVTIGSESKIRKVNTEKMKLYKEDDDAAPYVAVLDPR